MNRPQAELQKALADGVTARAQHETLAGQHAQLKADTEALKREWEAERHRLASATQVRQCNWKAPCWSTYPFTSDCDATLCRGCAFISCFSMALLCVQVLFHRPRTRSRASWKR